MANLLNSDMATDISYANTDEINHETKTNENILMKILMAVIAVRGYRGKETESCVDDFYHYS